MSEVRTVVLSEALSWGACYPNERMEKLYSEPVTVQEILTKTAGEWEKVPTKDRVWTVMRKGILSRKQLLEFLARNTERSLGRIKNPDTRSIAVIAALRGDCVTPEIRNAAHAAHAAHAAAHAAYAAAHAAYAADAAAHAAHAADAAAHAAHAAAHAAHAAYARKTEEEKQVADLLEIISSIS